MQRNYTLHDVFISYRREETDGTDQGTQIAKAIYEYLSSKGVRVFLDTKKMENGSWVKQLRWQIRQAPNYIFIATGAAMKFKDDKDCVAKEVRLALKLYGSQGRVILPVIPSNVTVPKESDNSYPPEIRRLLKLQGQKINADFPEDDKTSLKEIHSRVTKVNRSNLWNAGSRWLEEASKEGGRFAALDISRKILPMASDKNDLESPFPISVYQKGNDYAPLMDKIKETPGHLYLIGEGGIGKTTALLSIMQEVYGPGKDETDIDRMRLNGQVPLFVELSRAPDTYGKLYDGGKSTFIHRAIYHQIRRDLRVKQVSSAAVEEVKDIFTLDPDTAVKPIHDLFTQKTPTPEYLLLLDGLNEVSRTEIGYTIKDGDGTQSTGKKSVVSMVREEIQGLMDECPNVRVILTSRSKEQTDWGVKPTLLYLSGVREDDIKSYLNSRQVPEERIDAAMHNEKLKEILRIPLFLTLYSVLEGDDDILTRGEILHLFFHQKKEHLYTAKERNEVVEKDVRKAASADQSDRLTAVMQSFILDFILPEIAWRMEQDGEFYIQWEGKNSKEGLRQIFLRVLTDRSDTAVCGNYAKLTFTDYRCHSYKGSTRSVANGLYKQLRGGEEDEEDAQDKIVGGILDNAVFSLGILQRIVGPSGIQFGFIHHHFRDYFAAVHQINRLRLGIYLHENKKDDLARQCLADWREFHLHSEVRRFIGETLCEAHNAPICDDKGKWHYMVPNELPCWNTSPDRTYFRSLLKRAFDIFRGRFGGQDCRAVWNLLEILKDVRKDLSGEDFSNLDFTACEINGHAIGHGQRKCVVNLQDAKLHDEFFLPRGHSSQVRSACFSSDGKRIVTSSKDNTAKVWDAETLQQIGTLKGHAGSVESACFSLDGKRIVTASKDNTAKVWDAETLQEVKTLSGHKKTVTFASYSPKGDFIVTASQDKTAKIWNVLERKEVGSLEEHTGSVEYACFSPDGQYVVTTSQDKTAKVWDIETLEVIKTLTGHTAAVNSASYSPNGDFIITASSDKTVKVWDAETLEVIKTLTGHKAAVNSASYSPQGRFIISASRDNTVIIWNAKTFQQTASFKDDYLFDASYCPNEKHIITISKGGTCKIWDSETLQEVGQLTGHFCWVNAADYSCSPDGKFIAIACGHTVQIWNMDTMRVFGTLNGHSDTVETVRFSPNGQEIVTASHDGTAKVWNVKTQNVIGTLNGNFTWVSSASYSPDGEYVVTANDITATVWNAKSFRKIGTLAEHTDIVNSACFSSDGKLIVTASHDKTARIWDAITLERVGILKGHDGIVNSAKFSADGKLIVTASHDKTARVWDAKTPEQVGMLKGHKNYVYSADFDLNGEFIVTASRDSAAKIWKTERAGDAENINAANNTKTWKEVGSLQGHTGFIFFAHYTTDGRFIITACSDGTARIWNSDNQECFRTVSCVLGLEVMGIDLRNLHPDSHLSDETKELLYRYGARVDERK